MRSAQLPQNGILFFFQRFHSNPLADFVAALTRSDSFSAWPLSVLTCERCSGDDCLAAEQTLRYTLQDKLHKGTVPEKEFLKILRTGGCTVTVFAAPFSDLSFRCFCAARDAGYFTALLNDQNPQTLHSAQYEEMLRTADACLGFTPEEGALFAQYGQSRVCVLPYFSPYEAAELPLPEPDKTDVVFYTRFLPAVLRSVTESFARAYPLPSAFTLQVVLLEEVTAQWRALRQYRRWLQKSGLQARVRLHTVGKHPQLFLREAALCLCDGCGQLFPPMALEGIAASLPTLVMTEGNSALRRDALMHIPICDEDALAARLSYFGDAENRAACSAEMRESAALRSTQALAAQWRNLLAELAQSAHEGTQRTNPAQALPARKKQLTERLRERKRLRGYRERRPGLPHEDVRIPPQDVRKIQLLLLDIMLEFDRVCRKHGLTYYLAGGTLLGAVRHQGFIPWDDDVDISMPRPDYERFLKLARTELPRSMVIHRDCPPFCHNRIELMGTVFHSHLRKGCVFVDIFVLDGSPEAQATQRQHARVTAFLQRCMRVRARPLPPLAVNPAAIFRYGQRLALKLTPRVFFKTAWEHCAKMYSTEQAAHWVCLPASVYTYEQERFPKEYWGTPVTVMFEGQPFPAMQHWADYLRCHYGDYMKLPPRALRMSHHYVYAYSLGEYEAGLTERTEREQAATT